VEGSQFARPLLLHIETSLGGRIIAPGLFAFGKQQKLGKRFEPARWQAITLGLAPDLSGQHSAFWWTISPPILLRRADEMKCMFIFSASRAGNPFGRPSL